MDAISVFHTHAFFKRTLWSSCFVFLFPFALLSSSSGADDIAPWSPALEHEKLWEGVLGCADAGDDDEIVKNALAGGSVPGVVQRDYFDCGTRALRAAASRMLVDTIEESLRWGGLHAFDREFRLDSRLAWEFGGDVRGELDTILPIGGVQRGDGTGRALFFQQGITFWEGRNDELRSDSNTGVVYRGHVSPDWILGGSLFFDYNFQREHSRLSVGVDAQNDNFYGGLNYYFTPSGREWRRGRADYEERVLEGWDLRWSFSWERLRVGGAFGTWVFDGEGPGRRQSASISAGYKVFPGVFFEAGYEYHDDRSVDKEWNVGLVFRYSLPDMEGIGGDGPGGGRAPDLWRIVDRERRILYEERLSHGRASAALTAPDTRMEEGESAVVQVVLNEAVEADVSFSLLADSSSTADADDYMLPSSITVPAGALSAEGAVDIVDDNKEEPDEILDLELQVARESSLLVTRGDSHNARIVIAASDNLVVGFATESTSVHEGMELHVPLALGEPAPADGLVLVASSDKEEDAVTDGEMQISPGAQNDQYVRVIVNADSVAEHTETVRLALSEPPGGLPEGWRIGRSEHMLMISANDQTAMFAESGRTANEGDDGVSFKVILSADAPEGGVPLAISITSGNDDGDVTFEAQSFTIAEGEREHILDVVINDDNLVEPDEVVTFTLSKGAGVVFPDGWGDLGTQTTFELTIRDNDSASIGFTTTSSTLMENDSIPAILTVSMSAEVLQEVVVTLAESGDDNNDLAFSPSSLTFAPGETSKDVTLTVNDANNDNRVEEDVEITYMLEGTLPGGVTFAVGEEKHVVTLVDDDKTVGFKEPSSSATEGTNGHPVAVVLNFDPPEDGLKITAAASGEHADDVSIPLPELRFADGTRELSVLLNVPVDNFPEGAERVMLTLSGELPESWEFGQRTHELTIPPNENEVAFETPSTEVKEGDGTVDVALKLNRPAPEGLVLAFDSSSPDDAVPTSPTLQVPAEATSATLTVRIPNDDVGELGETVTISILESSSSLPEGWSIGSQGTHDLILTDDDLVVGFGSPSSQVRESDLTTNLQIVLSEVGAPAGGMSLSVSATGNEEDDISFATLLPISEGEAIKDLRVMLAQDGLAEDDELIVLTLSGNLPSPWEFGQQSHELTILLNDQVAMFAEAGHTVGEGDGTTSFRVTLSEDAPAGGVPLQVAITSGNDDSVVTFAAQNFTIAEGEREHTISAVINDDNLVEPDEVVTFTLSKGAGAAFPDAWGDLGAQTTFELTIRDDDSATVGFTTATSTLTEGDSTATLTVSMSAELSQEVEVTLSESGDDNNDLAFSPSSLTFAPGETSKEVTLTVNSTNDDNRIEEDVEIIYTLGGTLPEDVSFAAGGDRHVVTFVDDDSATVGFTTATSTLTEGDSTATLTVSMSAELSQEVEVTLSESGDDNNDLAFSPSSLTFASGETSKEVTLTVNTANADDRVEEDVEITYTLGGTLPGDVTFAVNRDKHVVTFVDDDKTIRFKELSSSASEGTNGHPVAVVLNIDPPADGLEITAMARGEHADDVSIPSPALNFTGSTRELSVLVDVSNDIEQESAEIVSLELEETATPLPVGWTLVASGDNGHELTIEPNDQTAMFAEAGRMVDEDAGTVPFRVTLSADAPAGGVPLEVAITSGNDDGDVTFATQSFTIAEGEREHTISVVINDDNLFEPDEVVTFTLSKGAGAAFPDEWGDLGAQTTFELTIRDDDSATVGFTTTTSTLTEGDSTATLTVSMSAELSQEVEVTLSESGDDNNDLAFSPSLLTFAPGETSKEVTLTVNSANDDNRIEEDVEITYTLGGTLPGDVSFAAGGDMHVVTFVDDDSATVGFTTTTSTLMEDDSTATLTVSMSTEVLQEVEVTLSESGDDNNDLAFSPSSLTFASGETSKEVTLTVNTANADDRVEEDVEITYTLGGTLPGDVTFAVDRDKHVVTFIDDDKTIRFKELSSSASEGTNGHPVAVVLNLDPPADGLEIAAVARGEHADDVSIPSPTLNFTGSTRELSVLVDVSSDIEQESAEIVSLELEEAATPLPAGWTLVASGDDGHDLTILPSDQTAVFAEAGRMVDEDAGTVPFRVTLSADAPAGGVPLEVAITSGNDDGDVTFATQGFTIAEGGREHTLTVEVDDDDLVEPDEVIRFTLSKGGSFPQTWGDLGAQTIFDLTIRASDGSIEFASPSSIVEENAGSAMLALDVTGVPPAAGLPMRVEISGLSAAATTDDYDFDPPTFTLTPVEDGTGYALAFPITDDDLPEENEVFTITLHTGEGFPNGWGELGEQRTHELTIPVNDKVIGFADTLPAELGEGTTDFPLEVVWNAATEGSFTMVVTLEKDDDGDTDEDVYIYGTDAGTLHEGVVSGRFSYEGPAGSDGGLTLTVRDDVLAEDAEDVVVRLAPDSPLPAGWTVEPAEYRFTIPVNDKIAGFNDESSGLVENAEDSRGEVSEDVVLKLNVPAPAGGLNLVVSINEGLNDDGENIDMNVMTGEGGVVSIPEGETEVLLPVMAVDDDIPESDEPVVLTLSRGENWPEGWEIGSSRGGDFFATHTATILGNDKKIGWSATRGFYVSETNRLAASDVVTNYPAPAGGFRIDVAVAPYTGSYAQASVPGDLSFNEYLYIPGGSRETSGSISQIVPTHDNIAEPDEAALFRLTLAGGGQLPPGWEWSNRDYEAIILANDNDFTFRDEQNGVEGNYSEGDTVRLTAVLANPLPQLEPSQFISRGRIYLAATEHSDDISITPVAPLIYDSAFHYSDGRRKEGPEFGYFPYFEGAQENRADYVYSFSEGGLTSISIDVAINRDSDVEPPETIVIRMGMVGPWGTPGSIHNYTLTINDEGGTGMVGFSETAYGIQERTFYPGSGQRQDPGVLVELTSPAPKGGIDLELVSDTPSQLLVVETLHVPEYRERFRLTQFYSVNDGIQEPDENYCIRISGDTVFPSQWGINPERSCGEVVVYSNDNFIGIAGFLDPGDNLVKKSVSLDEGASTARLVLNVPNDPPEYLDNTPSGLHLRLNVIPDPNTVGANFDDIGNFASQDFTIPRRNQEGSFQHVVEIPITDDMDAERIENFSFHLTTSETYFDWSRRWGRIDTNNDEAALTILSDDISTVGFSSAAGGEAVPEGGLYSAMIELSNPVSVPVSVNVTAEELDGDGEADISISQGTLTLPANVTEMPFPISIIDDDLTEGEEAVVLRLSAGENFPDDLVSVTQGNHVFTILTSDNIIEFTPPGRMVVEEDIGTFDFTVTLSSPAPAGGLPLMIVSLDPRDGLLDENDFTLAEFDTPFTITPEDGLEYTFSITITQNDGPEDIETNYFFLQPLDGFPEYWGGPGPRDDYRLFVLENES